MTGCHVPTTSATLVVPTKTDKEATYSLWIGARLTGGWTVSHSDVPSKITSD